MTTSRELALALRAAGVPWVPASGDRFTMLDPQFDGEVFTVAEMVVEVQAAGGTPVLGFNGTTEWALDSVDLTDAVWLPREDQLRELLGGAFRRLERTDGGFEVVLQRPGAAPESIPAETAADAYGLAVLAQRLPDDAPG